MTAAIFFAGIMLWATLFQIRLSYTACFGILWLIFVWILTFTSHTITGFVSPDEVFFATEKIEKFFSNRTLWLFINRLTGLFTDDIINVMRFLNLGFVILLYVTAVRFLKSLHPLVIALSLTYTGCIAALNLRDVAILFGLFLFIVKRGEHGHSVVDQFRAIINSRWVAGYLFLLRPLQVLLLFVSGLRLHLIIGVIFVAIAFLQTSIGERYFFNFSYYTQNFNEAISDRAEDKDLGPAKPTAKNVAFWTARFVFAPSPVSIVKRFAFDKNNYDYGTVDLGFRAVNRFVLYGLYCTILFYAIKSPHLVFSVMQKYSFVLKFGLLFSVLYALFNFGVSHERIKMNLVVLTLYLVDRIRCSRWT